MITMDKYAVSNFFSGYSETNIYDNVIIARSPANVETHAVLFAVKRVSDVILSSIALAVFLPFLFIVALCIVVDDFGSPIYAATRIGKDGRPFKMLKFRSMKKEADRLEDMLTEEEFARYKREYKLDIDPRITRVGRFIRKTSIDELPQLINIIKGDLSIIGPRPVLQEETEVYGIHKREFLSVKPGLTGYWQAYARNNAGYEDGRRQAMELYYVDNISLKLDIKIFFKTISTVLRKTGAK